MSWFRRGRDKENADAGDPVDWVGDEGVGDTRGRRAPGEASGARGPRASRGYEQADDLRSDQDGADGSDGSDPSPGEGSDRRSGPWDVTEVEGTDGYVDLGALWLPGQDGMELRLEVEEETSRVISATAQIGGSAVQLQAFAAPRTAGIWDEIREEIAGSITSQGGEADQVPGPFGQELLAKVPSRGADGKVAFQPARFAGVDGPRWFLRAVFHGPAAFSHDEAGPLEALVRGAVVVRGGEAMAPRELLTLTLPGAESAVEAEVDDAGDERAPLAPFERGPEITELR